MKLKGIHLFIILLLSLIFCCGLGNKIFEGMSAGRNDMEATRSNRGQGSFRDTPVTPWSSFNEDDYPQASINGPTYNAFGYNYKEGLETITPTSNTAPTTNTATTNTSADKTVVVVNGKTITATHDNTVLGIPKSQIPSGDEDLYILKSQVVPPVCPICPSPIISCDKKKDCPPCAPCGRCPEPSFECKKVPSYKPENQYLPVPVLADFSSFGM